MSESDQGAKHPNTAASAAEPKRSTWRRWFTWRRILLAAVVVVAATFAVRWIFPNDVDDGFIAFEPDVSLFPAAPVADAEMVAGIGRPASWYNGGFFCPYGYESTESAFGNDWHTVRHDWMEDGADKSWIVSERTTGYTDLDEFDDYINGLHERIKYCGWEYDSTRRGTYNSVLTELDGLPDGSFAYTADASPESVSDAEFAGSNPDDFHALGAVLPGHKRGQVMFVMWIGWGVDVPTDEFVATANAMYDAAHRADNPPPPEGDDDKIDFDYVDLDLERAGVNRRLGSYVDGRSWSLKAYQCGRFGIESEVEDWLRRGHWTDQSVTRDDRSVRFLTARWQDGSDYFGAKQGMEAYVSPTCVDTLQRPVLLIEQVEVSGLPDGTLTSVWRGEQDVYGALITDDERHLMMIVTWAEVDAAVPTDLFTEVVNKAWTQLLAENP